MIALAVRFLAGRYHATPWGHHANEGVVEWPPSPWRLLRALVATWRRSLPEVPAAQVGSLLAALTPPPLFHLPAGAPAHSRHFMPWYKKGPDDRTQVLDTFVALERHAPVVLAWPDAHLNEGQKALLGALLTQMPYLGRAESWAEAELCAAPADFNCRPLARGESLPAGTEPVRVLVPDPNPPEVLLEALMIDTEDLRTRTRRLDPPGSQWVTYARSTGTLVSHPLPRAVSLPGQPLHGARYALDALPLPRLTEAVTVGEWARRAALSHYGKLTGGGQSPVLMGREGRERMTGHRHAYYLPSDEDGDGRIDHLTIYAPLGFDATEQQALARMRRLWEGGERAEVQLALLGLYSRTGLQEAHPWFRPARVWESVTPYVLTRYPKMYRDGRPKLNERGEQLDGPADQVRREWAALQAQDPSLPDLLEVVPVDGYTPPQTGRRLRWLEYRRWRSRGQGANSGFAFGLRLTFARPVAGPIALGYGCHFGLGQFRPVV